MLSALICDVWSLRPIRFVGAAHRLHHATDEVLSWVTDGERLAWRVSAVGIKSGSRRWRGRGGVGLGLDLPVRGSLTCTRNAGCAGISRAADSMLK